MGMKELSFTIFKGLHRLLRGRGLTEHYAVLRTIYNFLFVHLKPAVKVVEVEGHRMHLHPDDLGFSRCLIMGDRYESDQTALFKEIVKSGMVVADLGAHLGYYTLLAAERVGNDGRVFAFEPDPENYALLASNIKDNGYNHNVITVQKAVYSKVGVAKLSAMPGHKDSSTLYGASDYIKLGTVETTTLDEFFRDKEYKLDVVKMDIEGAEIPALKGMTEVSQRNPHLKLIVECYPVVIRGTGATPEEFFDTLWKLGFTQVSVVFQPLEALEIPRDVPHLVKKASEAPVGVNLLCEKDEI